MSATQELIEAAQQGNLDAARAALEKGVSADTRDEFEQTVLCWACMNRHPEVAKLLLERGADPNLRGSMTRPLAAAASQGLLDVVKLLLEKNAELDSNAQIFAEMNGFPEIVAVLKAEEERREKAKQAYEEAETPAVVEAASAGDLDAVAQALAAGADMNATDREGRTALVYAAGKAHQEVLDLLLAKGADVEKPDPDGWTPLMFAGNNGHPGCMKALVAKGAKVTSFAMLASAQGGNPATVDVLLDAGLDPSVRHESGGWCGIYAATKSQDAAMVAHLLSKGAKPDVATDGGWTALMVAAKEGNEEIASLLLEKGADPNAVEAQGSTALMGAAGAGSAAIVRRLLAAGARADIVENQLGANALIAAAIGGNAEIVGLLLERGLDPDTRTNEGFPALVYCAGNGDEASVKLLLDRKATVDAANEHGETALLRAAAAGHAGTVDLLLTAGADVNHVSGEGFTALMLAADKGHPEVVRRLLSTGADKDRRHPYAHKTAYDYGRISGNEEVEALLAPPAKPIPKVTQKKVDAAAADAATKELGDAIWSQDLDRAVLALEAGAKIGGTGEDIPLLIAAHAGATDIVRLLLENGADVNAVDVTGLTALAKACGGCHVAMARALLEKGATVTGDVRMAAGIHAHPGIMALLECASP